MLVVDPAKASTRPERSFDIEARSTVAPRWGGIFFLGDQNGASQPLAPIIALSGVYGPWGEDQHDQK